MMPYKTMIENWFQDNRMFKTDIQGWYYVYVFIPTRSLGKPYDDTRYLTDIIETDDKLVLKITTGLTLTFFDLEKISEREIEGRNHLIFAPFKRFELTNGKETEVFTEGEVMLAT